MNDNTNGIVPNEVISNLLAEIDRLKKENEQLKNATELTNGLLHAHSRTGNYPCIYIDCDLPDGDSTEVVMVEYSKDDGKLHVYTYNEECDEPISSYHMQTDLREAAKKCRESIRECEKVLEEAYREEYPEEVITIREEAELKNTIETAKAFLDGFTALTGDID